MVATSMQLQPLFSVRIKSIEKEMSFARKAIKSSSTVELLGITFDKKLHFKSHIKKISCKANNKIKALSEFEVFLRLKNQKFYQIHIYYQTIDIAN